MATDSISPGITTRRRRPAPVDATGMTFQRNDLSAVRHFTRDQVSRHGLSGQRLSDLVVAVNELATNAVVHTPGPGTLRIWRELDQLVCEVSDPGQATGVGNGHQPSTPTVIKGHGLWVVNQICDQVEQRTSTSGTTIRIYYDLA